MSDLIENLKALGGIRKDSIQNKAVERIQELEAANAALRADKKMTSERLRYLAQFWNPNFDFASDEIGKWVVIGDYDQMIKAIDQGIKAINAARKETQT